jgi:hypothetical protein
MRKNQKGRNSQSTSIFVRDVPSASASPVPQTLKRSYARRMRANNKINYGINSPIDFATGGVKKKSSIGLPTSMPTSAVMSCSSMTRQPSTSSNLTFVPRAMSSSEIKPHMPFTPELARELGPVVKGQGFWVYLGIGGLRQRLSWDEVLQLPGSVLV